MTKDSLLGVAKQVVKVILAIVLLYLLYRNADKETLSNLLSEVDYKYLALGLVGIFLSTFFTGIRWYFFVRYNSRDYHVFDLVRLMMIGAFFGQFLPSNVGGDFYRMVGLRSLGETIKNSFVLVASDRIFGVTYLVLLTVLVAPFYYHIFPFNLFLLVFIVSLGVVCGVILSVSLRFYFYKPLSRYFNRKFLFLYDMLSAVYRSVRGFDKVLLISALSLFIHICTISGIYFIGLSLSYQANILVFFSIVPVVFFLMLLPISFAGWGIREGAMVGLFYLYDPNSHDVVFAMSILYGLLSMVSALPGVFLWFFGGKKVIEDGEAKGVNIDEALHSESSIDKTDKSTNIEHSS